MSGNVVGEEVTVPTWDHTGDGGTFHYTKGTVVDVQCSDDEEPDVITVEIDEGEYIRLDYRSRDEAERASGREPHDRPEPSSPRSDSVFCPQCSREATAWENGEKYGIECPHCGHVESFSH